MHDVHNAVLVKIKCLPQWRGTFGACKWRIGVTSDKDCLGCVAGYEGCYDAWRRWHPQGFLCGVPFVPACLYGKKPQTTPGEPHPHPHWGETMALSPLSLPFKSQGYSSLTSAQVASTSGLTLGSTMSSDVVWCDFCLVVEVILPSHIKSPYESLVIKEVTALLNLLIL